MRVCSTSGSQIRIQPFLFCIYLCPDGVPIKMAAVWEDRTVSPGTGVL